MEILLFKFNKKLNSTKVPDDTSGVAVNADIKQNVMGGREGFSKDCFTVTPTFFIKNGLTPEKASCYNYCKAFGRYYFIKNSMVDIANAITLFCEVDALATLRSEILNTTARVIYSSSNGDNSIDDPRNGPKPNATYTSTFADTFPKDVNGTFILTLIGTSSEADASPFSVAYNLPTAAAGKLVADALLDQDFVESLKRCWNDVEDMIVSLQWTPIAFSSGLGQMQNIKVGDFDTGVRARPIVRRYIELNVPITVSKRYSDYRQSSKYVEYLLHIPFCGTYKLSADTLKSINTLTLVQVLDTLTGDVVVKVTNEYNQAIVIASGNAYSQLPVASESGIGKNTLAAIGGLVAAGTAFATGGLSAATAAGAATITAETLRTANAIGHVMSGVQSTIGVFGLQQSEVTQGGAISTAVGGLAILRNELIEIAHDSVFSPGDISSTRGNPLGRNARLGDLSGYTQTEGASIDSNDYLEIVYIANKQLDAGFFIE